MTPKEKAEELFEKYYDYLGMHDSIAKECALIAVDEIINFMTPETDSKEAFEYWEEVKKEIEAL